MCRTFNYGKTATVSFNRIIPQTTTGNPQKRQFDHGRICQFGHETQTFKNMTYEMVMVKKWGSTRSTYIIFGQRNEQLRLLFHKTSSYNSSLSNATSVYTYFKFIRDTSLNNKIMQGCFKPSPVYSVLNPIRLTESDTNIITIYDPQKCPTVWHLNLSQLYNVALINLSRYFLKLTTTYLEEIYARYVWILESRIYQQGGPEVIPLMVQPLLSYILRSDCLHGFLRILYITQ